MEIAFTTFTAGFGRDIFDDVQALFEPMVFLHLSQGRPTSTEVANHVASLSFQSIDCYDSEALFFIESAYDLDDPTIVGRTFNSVSGATGVPSEPLVYFPFQQRIFNV